MVTFIFRDRNAPTGTDASLRTNQFYCTLTTLIGFFFLFLYDRRFSRSGLSYENFLIL